MLVLSRKVDESLRIGPDIVVTVVRISPDKVRLGITAPRELNVVRAEIDDHRDDDYEHGGES